MAQRGRPCGPLLVAVRKSIGDEPKSARQVAHDLLLSVDDAKNTVRRLYDRGDIEVIDKKRVEGSKKPVSIYAVKEDMPAMAAMYPNVTAGKK